MSFVRLLLANYETLTMRYFLLFILIPFLSLNQKAKSDSTYEFKFFKNGNISTKRLLTTDKIHFGYLKAYKVDGKEIYITHTRNVGGHSSVEVEYYPNGSIKKAHATDQPDGGIQYGDVTHYFDEQGNVTNVVDLSDDGHGRTIVSPIFRQEQPYIVPKTEEKPKVVECAVIYVSEIYVVNLSRKSQTVVSIKTPPNGIDFLSKKTINSGDTVKFGNYVEAQMFTPASTVFSYEIETKKKNDSNSIHAVWGAFVQVTPEKRQYYLLLIDKKIK